MQFLKQKSAKKAVAYYRHSAEDKQENSVPIQREQVQKFATKYAIEVIHEEADEGVSGLTANRPGFRRLFKDWVENLNAPAYDYILVFDVSRWGRFQNPNEAAHYEFICELRKKKVIYIVRGSVPKEKEDEQEMGNVLLTLVDRVSSAKFSRDLGQKVWYGCMRLSKEGYSTGGIACYGMARLLLDENKKPIGILKKGQHKMISNQRVRFTPLNDETTKTVKEIFNLFDKGRSPERIAQLLNERGIKAPNGGEWKRSKIIHILSNQVYVGTRIYNKTSSKLKTPKVDNPKSEWVITSKAFEAVIEPEQFWRVQERLFWTSSRWKRGMHHINKVRRFVEDDIKSLLFKHGVSEDDIWKKLVITPITYTISYDENSILYRYFVITEQMRNFESVFCISINLFQRELIDKVFYIPTKEFNINNFIILSEKDPHFLEYSIENSQIEDRILALIK